MRASEPCLPWKLHTQIAEASIAIAKACMAVLKAGVKLLSEKPTPAGVDEIPVRTLKHEKRITKQLFLETYIYIHI
jgi:hypothetical protein